MITRDVSRNFIKICTISIQFETSFMFALIFFICVTYIHYYHIIVVTEYNITLNPAFKPEHVILYSVTTMI